MKQSAKITTVKAVYQRPTTMSYAMEIQNVIALSGDVDTDVYTEIDDSAWQ